VITLGMSNFSFLTNFSVPILNFSDVHIAGMSEDYRAYQILSLGH